MKAVIFDKKQNPKLVFTNVEIPIPKDNEVLIQVRASSINAADMRLIQLGITPKRKIFGADVVGTIIQIGKNIKEFQVGDDVVGDLSNDGFGAFAEFTVAKESVLIHKPKSITFIDAASIPLAAITSLQGLRNCGNIELNDNVLLVGASGGVGCFTIQLAKYFGAKVTAVCSTKKTAQAKILGADTLIDYTKENFLKQDFKYDKIFAINGNYPLLEYKKILKDNGKFILIGGDLSQFFKFILVSKFLSIGSKKFELLFAKSNREDLKFIFNLVKQKKIKSIIEKIYPLEKTNEAFEYIKNSHASGKVVIQVK